MNQELCLTKRNVREAAEAYCAYNHFDVRIEFDRAYPEEGYFDRTSAKIVVGVAMTELPVWSAYYFLYRLLALAHQVLRPADFDPSVVASKDYRIAPDGKCAKWTRTGWVAVDVAAVYPEDKAYWTAAADNMPHLLSAGEIAVAETYDLMTNDWDKENLHHLHYMVSPKKPFAAEAYDVLFGRIDQLVAKA